MYCHHLVAIFAFAALCHVAHADWYLLTRDGTWNGPSISFPGLTYQAIRFEFLCGTAGTDNRYLTPYSAINCGPNVMNAYSNSSDTFALYDNAGVRLEGAIVGGGTALCMCFSLASTITSGDFCWWVDAFGRANYITGTGDWNLYVDGSYRPGSAKSLPQCANIDVAQASAHWSATAVLPSFNGSTSFVGGTTTTSSITTTSTTTMTYIPSVVNYTATSLSTFHNANGQLTTATATMTTQLPVVTVTTTGGLSRSDRIALGVGLGIGIPSVIGTIITIIISLNKNKNRRGSPSGSQMIFRDNY